MAAPLSVRIGAPVAVENRVGASGNDATREVVRATPDGGSLLLCWPVNTINATLIPSLDFDFEQDIVPVTGIARVPLIVEVHPSMPVRSLPDLIAYARANPGAIRVAYAGRGTPQHVAIEMFGQLAAVRLTLVPYPGSAQALAALLEGWAHAMFDPAPARAEGVPEFPTVAEELPGYEGGSWFGLGAPRGTPAEVVARLNAAANEALADEAVRRELIRLGGSPMPGSPATFAAFVASETARYAEIIRLTGIRAG